jgi:hypothetical protein
MSGGLNNLGMPGGPMLRTKRAGSWRRRTGIKKKRPGTEQQITEGDFESPVVRDAVTGLGLADVRAFGLTWEDFQRILSDLGYAARVEIALTGSAGASSPH